MHGGKSLICGMVHGIKLRLEVGLVSIRGCLFLLCLWQGGWPLMPKAFFDGVQDFLAKLLFHPLFAVTPPRQPPQLTDIPVEFCNLLLGGVRADEFHGGALHPQVSFH